MAGQKWGTWRRWVLGLGLLLAGVGGLFLFSDQALRAAGGWWRGSSMRTMGVQQAEQALVVAEPQAATATTGGQVTLTWELINAGEAAWTVDLYRFIPVGSAVGPVLPLPFAIEPGTRAKVRTTLTVPVTPGLWQPSWVLTGPSGPVPGGRISARVGVVPGDR